MCVLHDDLVSHAKAVMGGKMEGAGSLLFPVLEMFGLVSGLRSVGLEVMLQPGNPG